MGGQPNTHAALSGGKVCKPPVHGPDEGSPSLGNHQGGTSSPTGHLPTGAQLADPIWSLVGAPLPLEAKWGPELHPLPSIAV